GVGIMYVRPHVFRDRADARNASEARLHVFADEPVEWLRAERWVGLGSVMRAHRMDPSLIKLPEYVAPNLILLHAIILILRRERFRTAVATAASAMAGIEVVYMVEAQHLRPELL